LPNLSSSNEPLPLSIAEEADTLNPEKWVQVFMLSEGEMGNQLHIATNKPDSKHAHTQGTSTLPKDSSTNKSSDAPAQGEHIQALSNTSTSSKGSSKPVCTTDHSEHTHRPELLAAPPSAPENQSVLADTTASCCTTRWQASASTQPYEHVVLDLDHAGGEFHHVLRMQALDTLHSSTNELIRDPKTVYIANNSPFSVPQVDNALLMHIEECLHNMHCNQEDKVPCIVAWLAWNHGSLAPLSKNDGYHISDESSPKWADTLAGPRKEEWLAALETEFNVLLKQEVFKDFPHKSIPCNAHLLMSGVVTKIKTDGYRNEVCDESLNY
jgi:hypothetical protein